MRPAGCDDLGQFVQKCVAVGQTVSSIGQSMRRRCSSLLRRWVMSRVILAKPVNRPASSRIASITTLAQTGCRRGGRATRLFQTGRRRRAIGAHVRRARRPIFLGVEARIMLTR